MPPIDVANRRPSWTVLATIAGFTIVTVYCTTLTVYMTEATPTMSAVEVDRDAVLRPRSCWLHHTRRGGRMKRWTGAVLLLLSAIGCGGGDPSPQDRLAGNWAFAAPDGMSAIGLTFTGADYSALNLALTSANTANAEVEKGGFNASDTQIRFFPREWSCALSDPTYAFPYKFVGSSLSITNGNTVIVFEPVVAAPATTFAVTTGCNQTGTFVPSPLAPVIN